jgi:hypothetical protein
MRLPKKKEKIIDCAICIGGSNFAARKGGRMFGSANEAVVFAALYKIHPVPGR